MLNRLRNTTIFTLLIGISLIKCKKDDDNNTDPNGGDTHTQLKREILENYAHLVSENYNDALLAAQELKQAVDAFVQSPAEATHKTAKDAWLKARESYGQTEAFRFSSGPIDAVDGPEGLLNAWPLDENYIDYTRDNRLAGIINDSTGFPEITEELLKSLNEANGEKNISTGYHAIEFLLWGQDDPNTALKTPGNRSYTDYITGPNSTANYPQRRGKYLQIASGLLIKHLQSIKNQWDEGSSTNYRASFIALNSNKALQNILTGIGTLSKGELAGERMFTALKNKDQEDEHSCFSDNTHRDVYLNALGINNVYFGTYKKTDGTMVNGSSIHDLLTKVAPDLAAKLKNQLEQSVINIMEIPVPFDFALTQEEVGGSGPITKSVLSLQQQGDFIAQAAKELGITISTDLPE